MGRLWRYGGPGGLQTFMEVAAFTVFLMLVGRLGEVPLAATTLAFTINNARLGSDVGLGHRGHGHRGAATWPKPRRAGGAGYLDRAGYCPGLHGRQWPCAM